VSGSFGFLDCFSGISGDKFLGALIGAGLEPALLKERLAALDVPGWELRAETVLSSGISGTKVTVDVEPGQRSRDWRTIREIIERSSLEAPVRESALAAFAALAEAEATVHGCAVEDVHFHEVGAVDSIVDIVGAAIGLAELGITELWSTPVRLGSGTVMTSHGELPVPAPATARLLRGIPVYAGEIPGELTTPTGATLLRAFVSRYAPMPPIRVSAEGWGAGTLKLALPNLLRLSVGERETGGDVEEVVVLETCIDHETAEIISATIDLLLEEGALDAWSEPVRMKKGRLGTGVTVLARTGDTERLSELLMRHTGTLGVRRTPTWRQLAPRRLTSVTTSLGTVRVKVQGEGADLRARPESDDVVAVARATGLPLGQVMRRLTEEARAALRSEE
jgi:uncharacterized protein (TIGR00299 family) protein